MPKVTREHLFICHSGSDKDLALSIKSLLRNRLGPRGRRVRIFCSSDIGSIESGRTWFDQVVNALRRSRVCITLLTPHSIHQPWVLFESGGAFVRSGPTPTHRMLPVYAAGATPAILPGPLAHIQARNLGNSVDVQKLLREVAHAYGVRLDKVPLSEIRRLCAKAKTGAKHWQHVRRAFVGDRLGTTPFSADILLSSAKRHFFAAGQNLHHLATSKGFRQRLFSWLRNHKNRKAQLLLCDPEHSDAMSAWRVVGDRYPSDLKKSIRHFRKWLELARNGGLGRRLDIRLTKLVTAGMTCVDPDRNDGTLVFIPVVFGRPISSERPHISFSKSEHFRVFDHYWDAYKDEFARAKRLPER